MEPRANWQPRRDPARLPQVRPGRAVDRLAGFRCEQQTRRPLPWSARISAILDLHRERRLQLQVPGERVAVTCGSSTVLLLESVLTWPRYGTPPDCTTSCC